MALTVQVSFDAADPGAQAGFWAVALDYVPQPPPPGFATWLEALEAFGMDTSDPNRAAAIVDPEGVGPRLFFQKVPEGKTAKNRVHLDVAVGHEHAQARADELVALGAELVAVREDPTGQWIVLRDPEGNEFCLV